MSHRMAMQQRWTRRESRNSEVMPSDDSCDAQATTSSPADDSLMRSEPTGSSCLCAKSS